MNDPHKYILDTVLKLVDLNRDNAEVQAKAVSFFLNAKKHADAAKSVKCLLESHKDHPKSHVAVKKFRSEEEAIKSDLKTHIPSDKDRLSFQVLQA
jgi:hypothetical protein